MATKKDNYNVMIEEDDTAKSSPKEKKKKSFSLFKKRSSEKSPKKVDNRPSKVIITKESKESNTSEGSLTAGVGPGNTSARARSSKNLLEEPKLVVEPPPKQASMDNLNINSKEKPKEKPKKRNFFQKMSNMFTRKKENINLWFRSKVEAMVLKMFRKSYKKLKLSVEKKNINRFFKSFLNDLIDEIWPELEEEFVNKSKTMKEKHQKLSVVAQKKLFALCVPFHFIRAKILYTLQPCDKVALEKLKSIPWWILQIISIIPIFGSQTLFYFIYFLCIDKKDEYQLVKFILDFKEKQFIGKGVLLGVWGYISYFHCTFSKNYTGDTTDTYKYCMENGPGILVYFYVTSAAFILQFLLVYLALILLRSSHVKEPLKLRYVDPFFEKRDTFQCCCCIFDQKNGGRLKMFLIFDLVCFFLTLGLVILLALISKPLSAQELRPLILFGDVLYGWFSFPIVFWKIPFFSLVLTKSRPTAYDMLGNCVVSSKLIKLEYERDEDPADFYKNNLTFDLEEVLANEEDADAESPIKKGSKD